MRETSSTELKRKKQHRSGDSPPTLALEEAQPAQSPEVTRVSLSNIEDEGVATSCKRIKVSAKSIKRFNHSEALEPQLDLEYTAERPADELEDPSDHLTLDSDRALRSLNGEARGQLGNSRSGKVTEKKTLGSSLLKRYNGPANNLPDYGAPVIRATAAIAYGRNKAMAGEKKTGMIGTFRPVNNLKNSGSTSSTLPRPVQKKAFDLHQDNFAGALDETPAAKRQKVGTEDLVQRRLSRSIIDISGDSAEVGLGPNTSSTSSTPRKRVQSFSSRSFYLNQPIIYSLGDVEEYKKTEMIIGFGPQKKSKSNSVGLTRRTFSRGEVESGSPQNSISLLPEIYSPVDRRTTTTNLISVGRDPIVIEDRSSECLVELGQAPKDTQEMARHAIQQPPGKQEHRGAEKLQHSPKHLQDKANGSLHTVEDLNINEGSSPKSLQSLYDTADEIQYLEEDSVDLLEHDGNETQGDRKNETTASFTSDTMKRFASPTSKSISYEGDIPHSNFSAARMKNDNGRTRRMLRPELNFEVTYLSSGANIFEHEDGCIAWRLQYSYDRKEFDIIANGEPINHIYPGLVLKPEKVHIIKYNNVSTKVAISRAVEPSTRAVGQFLLEMSNQGDGYRLAQGLKKLHQSITLSPISRSAATCPNDILLLIDLINGSVQLEKIFATAVNSKPAVQNHAQDISLLTSKEARRAGAQVRVWNRNTSAEKVYNEESIEAANIGRRRGNTADRDTSVLVPKPSIISRMCANSSTNTPIPFRVPKVVLRTRVQVPDSLRHSSPIREEFHSSRPTTRASSGQWTSERQFRPLKSRTPSPVRWTAENPSWMRIRSWEAPLIFPKEGKNRTTVDATDIERLDEGGFLNDNLISFYLRFLGNNLENSQPELAKRIYFHNTFFYEALTKGKVRSNNINYDAVKRWTSKIDLFSYDYIVIPVCEKLHWYVAIVCNAPKLLQPDTPEILKSQTNDGNAVLPLSDSPEPRSQESNEDPEASKALNISNDLVQPKSASLSMTAQVEQMSLEDQEQEWPEPDAVPGVPQTGTDVFRSVRINEICQSDDPMGGHEILKQAKNEELYPKGKKVKRKSIPPTRKYNPSDPRIITLDSLGQAHSPTCSNLKEYLICEAKERYNIDITPGRLGMTAKGLPQQSNYCDCGIFVLGYIEKFLKGPDEFVQNILLGDMVESRVRIEIKASQMRADIRELIFRLQAKQIQDEQRGREHRSQIKVAKTEALPALSSKVLDSKEQLVNGRSSNALDVEAESDSSGSMGSAKQSFAAALTGNASKRMINKHPGSRRHSLTTINGHGSVHVAKGEGRLEAMSMANGSRYFPMHAATPLVETKGGEIMEGEVDSGEEELILVTNSPTSRKRKSLSSPDSTDTSIQLDSPLHIASSERNRETTPEGREGARFMTHNTFKKFARSPSSPYQSTRSKTRREKTSEHYPVEINESPETHQLEVYETPPRQRAREDSFEDIMDLPTKSEKPKPLVHDNEHSPELQIVSPSKAMKRKGNNRQ